MFEKMASGFSKLFMMDGTNSRSKEKNLSSPGIDRGWVASKQREQFAHPYNVQNGQIQVWGCSSVVGHLPNIHKALGLVPSMGRGAAHL